MLLDAYVLEKALYELLYELNNRPAWLHIPIAGILSLCSVTSIKQLILGRLLDRLSTYVEALPDSYGDREFSSGCSLDGDCRASGLACFCRAHGRRTTRKFFANLDCIVPRRRTADRDAE